MFVQSRYQSEAEPPGETLGRFRRRVLSLEWRQRPVSKVPLARPTLVLAQHNTFQRPSNDCCSRLRTHGPDFEPAFKVRRSNDRKALIVKWTGRGMSRVCVA
jgi:hypothetical protein